MFEYIIVAVKSALILTCLTQIILDRNEVEFHIVHHLDDAFVQRNRFRQKPDSKLIVKQLGHMLVVFSQFFLLTGFGVCHHEQLVNFLLIRVDGV